MQDFIKVVETNRYYKHTCKNNDICQRNENQDVYIDLCFTSPQSRVEKDMKVDFNKLKNDEEYRNNYLREKEIAYNNYIKDKKRKQIEDEYIDEFNKYTFKKEQNLYDFVIIGVKANYLHHIQTLKSQSPYPSQFSASTEWFKHMYDFKYSGTKKRFINYVQNLTGQNINEYITMGELEYEEFQTFILERDPDYKNLFN